MTRRYRIKHKRHFSLFLRVIGICFFGFILFLLAFFAPFLFNYVSHPGITLHTTQDQRITMALLGIGGGTHDGPLLTDTMIFASIDPLHNQVDLVSIPRDMWNPPISAKINATYAFAEQNKQGSGIKEVKSTLSAILGQQVNYGFRIDFAGFVKAVDQVGGLDVQVERTLDDYAYPIEGKEDDTCGHTTTEVTDLTSQIATASATEADAFPCRYMHLHIPTGMTHMDGQTALEFVRSRHAQGVEGSDFARSRRQAKVIAAFRQKVLSAQTLLNPVQVISLFNILKDSIDTDITQTELPDFLKLTMKMKGAKINSYVIDATSDPNDVGNLLVQGDPASYSGAYVLLPKAGEGNYGQIQSFVACKTQHIGCPTPTPSPANTSVKKS